MFCSMSVASKIFKSSKVFNFKIIILQMIRARCRSIYYDLVKHDFEISTYIRSLAKRNLMVLILINDNQIVYKQIVVDSLTFFKFCTCHLKNLLSVVEVVIENHSVIWYIQLSNNAHSLFLINGKNSLIKKTAPTLSHISYKMYF